jgi:hypothetical protein
MRSHFLSFPAPSRSSCRGPLVRLLRDNRRRPPLQLRAIRLLFGCLAGVFRPRLQIAPFGSLDDALLRRCRANHRHMRPFVSGVLAESPRPRELLSFSFFEVAVGESSMSRGRLPRLLRQFSRVFTRNSFCRSAGTCPSDARRRSSGCSSGRFCTRTSTM